MHILWPADLYFTIFCPSYACMPACIPATINQSQGECISWCTACNNPFWDIAVQKHGQIHYEPENLRNKKSHVCLHMRKHGVVLAPLLISSSSATISVEMCHSRWRLEREEIRFIIKPLWLGWFTGGVVQNALNKDRILGDPLSHQ